MAYAGTVTIKHNGTDVLVAIAETEAASTSEATITLPFEHGVVTRLGCSLDSGTGTTIDPILGTASDPSGLELVLSNDTAAASVDITPSVPVPFFAAGGVLYHRSQVDADTDNSITTYYHIRRGY
jgi:hypothetical protein